MTPPFTKRAFIKRAFTRPAPYGDGERGIFMVILGGILIGMLLMLGLAVDSGSLYTGQLTAQTAADAAVSSGAALLASRGNGDTDSIKKAMDEMARANLRQGGIPITPSLVITPNIDTWAGTVQLQIATDVPLRILTMVPGFARVGRVAADSRARVRPAVISLILDTSFSMCCPSGGGGDCDPSSGCPIAGSRLADLQNAVISFLGHFDETRDNINLVPFALGAEVLVPFNALGHGFSKSQIQQQIQNLVPGGATNPSDAFLRSYLDAQRIGAEKEVAYVYFSDGAPTAARFLFDTTALNPVKAAPWVNNILGYSWSQYDYLSWATYVGIAGNYLSLPSFFVYTPLISDWNPRLHVEALPPPQAKVVGKDKVELSQVAGLYQVYLNNLVLRLPDGSSIKVGNGWDKTKSLFDWAKMNYREEYFNYALALADFSRKKGGSWYAVGLGDPAPNVLNSSGQPDPYQNAENDFDRKDVFLTRVANDSCGLVRGDPDFPGFSNYNDLAAQGRHEGIYLATPSSDELSELFESIARRIKMQLVE